mgnify:CR=1 FL=1
MDKATIFDVAARAKVSNATVSRALNEPDKVKPETRKRVLDAAEELGYKANAFARGLASSKSTQVAIVVSDLARASVAEMVKGIIEVASSYSYSTLIFNSPGDEMSDNMLKDLVSLHVDGILYLVDEITENKYKMIKTLKDDYRIPMVLVNTVYPNDKSFLSVGIDYEKAAYEATKALVQEGRRYISLFSTKKRYPVSELKEKGYLRAVNDFDLTPSICYTSGNLDSNYKDITDFIERKEVDGVIGVRDSIAIACMNILIDHGFRVPDDVSIIGFQNSRSSLLCRPQLSTINVPIHEIGGTAMKALTSLMQKEDEEYVGQILLDHSIINRKTTK